jgi:hypothetical protein
VPGCCPEQVPWGSRWREALNKARSGESAAGLTADRLGHRTCLC